MEGGNLSLEGLASSSLLHLAIHLNGGEGAFEGDAVHSKRRRAEQLVEYHRDLVSEFRFIPNQTEDVELEVYNKWKECR